MYLLLIHYTLLKIHSHYNPFICSRKYKMHTIFIHSMFFIYHLTSMQFMYYI